MNNIFYTLFCILFFSNVGNSQSFKISKIIADQTTKLPLENVSIYNDKDNSTTNQEGLFVFVSGVNEINFNLLGYNSSKTNFEGIEKQDTIFMEAKTFELKEVVVTNNESFIKKVYDKMVDNYSTKYTSNFFLRNVLKKGNNIVVLQDIHAKRGKNSFPKNFSEIEVLNMRKTSFFEKKKHIDFAFPDFTEFFGGFYPALDQNIFTEVDYNEVDYRKFLFEAQEKNVWGQISKGYLIININDYAIIEFYVSMYDNPGELPLKKFKLSTTQYRTTQYEKIIKFNKNDALNKYYLSLSKLNAQVEVLADKKSDERFYYNLTMDYFTTNSITNEKVESNFDVDKDVFKAKFPYSATFWNNQNQLPLTNELKDFLKRVSDNKDQKKEFEIIGNF
ncbi:hypothetical protein ACNQGP_10430 [Flavobacterium sp. GT2N3]|uniref:hypothetical protein n=1 Tax=unclassified Flavobacterium TaxID=196869 RepID=UPI003AAC44EE